MEVEYITASKSAKEGFRINKFLTELGVVPGDANPMDLFCDYIGAIAQAKELRFHLNSKHILKIFHLIQEIVYQGLQNTYIS